MTQDFTITIEKDVPLPNGQTRGGIHARHKEKLMSMGIGDSFFLENMTKEEIANLIRYAKRLGVHLLARDTDEDEDYLAPGVRAWRVEQEDLPGRKPNASKSLFDDSPAIDVQTAREIAAVKKYWHNKRDHLVLVTNALSPKPEGFQQIDAQDYQALLATGEAFEAATGGTTGKAPEQSWPEETYWYHGESESVWSLPAGEPITESADVAVSMQIRKELFDAIRFAEGVNGLQPCRFYINESARRVDIKELDPRPVLSGDWVEADPIQFGEALIQFYDRPHFWRSPKTGSPLMSQPGYQNIPPFCAGWTEMSEYEYECEAITHAPDYNTFWRRADGTCTVVPPERYGKARKTAGAMQISEEVYEAWLLTEEDEL
jgi:hypothetical protein